MTSRQLQPPQQRCSAQRQPAALLCRLFSQRHTSAAHRQLQQHRRSHRSLEVVPARFANGSHLAYYEAPVAGSKKEKVASRIKAQRQRLKELQRETADQDGQVSHAQWSHLVQELREMSSNLSDVAKVCCTAVASDTSGHPFSSCALHSSRAHCLMGDLSCTAADGSQLFVVFRGRGHWQRCSCCTAETPRLATAASTCTACPGSTWRVVIRAISISTCGAAGQLDLQSSGLPCIGAPRRVRSPGCCQHRQGGGRPGRQPGSHGVGAGSGVAST
jgi:hypothetical protein